MDCLIKNGFVIDPAEGTNEIRDLLIKDGRFAPVKQAEALGANEVIDASGCYVVPGLIDAHTHVNRYGDSFGTDADMLCLPNGAVAAIDAGSCGADNIEGFLRYRLSEYLTNVKALIHVVSGGQSIGTPYDETADPAYFDKARILDFFEKYPDIMKGLKIRFQESCTKGFGLSPLIKMIEIADYIESKGYHCPAVIHLGKSEEGISLEDVLNVLRPGDVAAHIYQNYGETLLNADGTLKTCVRKARERGVLFDLAHGRMNFTFHNIRRAAEEGFWPDMLGTDIHKGNIYKLPAFNIMSTMTMMNALGMPFKDIVKAMTLTPALAYRLGKEFGRLKEGDLANFSVIEPVEKKVNYIDKEGTVLAADRYFTARLTVCYGVIRYRTLGI